MATEKNLRADTGFERQLAENCVEYYLFLIDEQADTRHHLARLESLRKTAVQLSQSLTKDYIWQRDEFQLESKTENGVHNINPRTILSPQSMQ